MLIFILCLIFCEVSGLVRPARKDEVVGVITFRMVSFSNLGHRLATGETCDNGWFGSRKCDPHFTVCFQQASISLSENSTRPRTCNFGGPITCGPFDNIAEFEFGVNWCSIPNPFLLNFTGAWNGLDIGVRVTEMERGSFLGSNTATGPLIDKFSYVFNGKPSSDTIFKLKLSGTTKANSTLVVETKVNCYPNYYDDHCTTYCTPEPNYNCDPATGQQVCKAGWSGEDCAAKVLSDNLTIHPISALGAQIDEMIVYGELDEPNTTTTAAPSTLLENSTVVVELTQAITEVHLQDEVVPLQPEEIANAHFDKQSGTSNSSIEPKATTSGVTTLRPSAFSSMWPLTVSLVVGGLSYYASTSPSVAPETTSASIESVKPEAVGGSLAEASATSTVIENGILVSAATILPEVSNSTVAPPSDPPVTSASPAGSVTTSHSDPTPSTIMVSVAAGQLSTSTEDPSSPVFTTSETTASMDSTTEPYTLAPKIETDDKSKEILKNEQNATKQYNSREMTTVSSTPRSAVENSVLMSGEGKVNVTAYLPEQSDLTVSETIRLISITVPSSTVLGDVSDASTHSESHSSLPGESTTILPEVSSAASKIPSPAENSTAANGSSSSETKASSSDVRINEMIEISGTSSIPTGGRKLTEPPSNQTILNIVLLGNVSSDPPNEVVLAVAVPTEAPEFLSSDSEVSEARPSSLHAPETTTKAKETDRSTVPPVSDEVSEAAGDRGALPGTGTQHTLVTEPAMTSTTGSTAMPENTTQVFVRVLDSTPDPNDIPDAAGLPLANPSSSIPFYTFHLPSGERFPEPLASLAFLDQLNSSVGGAIEELLLFKNISKEILHKELKTAVEFTGISLNRSMVVPQVTLYVTLNGSFPLNSSEYEAVWRSALTNMRLNATVTRNPFAVTHLGQNYASQHPIMIFLMALLSVAIVILVGIISVLARKPKQVSRTRQRRVSFGDDAEISSSFDNFAFSDQRTFVVPDGEIVSLEPSIYNEVHNAQDRLFSRRSAAHAAWKSPMPVTRDAASTNRTTTTFSKEPGSTI